MIFHIICPYLMSEPQSIEVTDLLKAIHGENYLPLVRYQQNLRFISGFNNLERDFPSIAKFIQSVPVGIGRHHLMEWAVANLEGEVSFPEVTTAKYFGFGWALLKEEYSKARRNDLNTKFIQGTLLGKKYDKKPVCKDMHIHTLYLKEMDDRHFCDICQKDISGGVMYRCDICDYDVCLNHS